jgi:hypothetical protein
MQRVLETMKIPATDIATQDEPTTRLGQIISSSVSHFPSRFTHLSVIRSPKISHAGGVHVRF